MVITKEGPNSFKISQGDLVIAVNPESKLTSTITLFNTGRGVDGDRAGFVINGPGEYEVRDVSVKGFLSEGADKKINTIYIVNIEGMNLCILGSLTSAELPAETIESLEDIDILFTPVNAYKLAVSLEPKLIIPMNYTPEDLKKFLKDAGEDSVNPEEKLVVKKKDLDGKEGDIVVLKES
ncbi:MBL fold metallo-hydrolase [Candidatus Parcubacteria bacterium]|nr:MBL fold metallo-hydrolase [Candidatus Parcubacteria bacterium]